MKLKYNYIIFFVILVFVLGSIMINFSSISSKIRIPKVVNTEYIEDNTATISKTSIIKGVSRVYVYTKYGEYALSDTWYYKKYYNREGENVMVKLKRSFYDDGMVHIDLYEIEDIKKEGE